MNTISYESSVSRMVLNDQMSALENGAADGLRGRVSTVSVGGFSLSMAPGLRFRGLEYFTDDFAWYSSHRGPALARIIGHYTNGKSFVSLAHEWAQSAPHVQTPEVVQIGAGTVFRCTPHSFNTDASVCVLPAPSRYVKSNPL